MLRINQESIFQEQSTQAVVTTNRFKKLEDNFFSTKCDVNRILSLSNVPQFGGLVFQFSYHLNSVYKYML